MIEVTCYNCQPNKIACVSRKKLPDNISQLGPGQTFKFDCPFCKNGLGKVNDVCSYCQGKLRKDKDGVYCSRCGRSEWLSFRKCLECGKINALKNERCSDCGNGLLNQHYY